MVELIPGSCTARLDPQEIFGRTAPLQVDLGCSDGAFLFALATRMPQKNFLGIERLAGRVKKACGKADKIDNMRVLHFETSYTVKYLLPGESVETFHLLFPDPWPKRRHHRRRIVTNDFLRAIWTALEENGILRIATDHLDYFTRICELARESARFAFLQPSAEHDFPVSAFERKFAIADVPIYRLLLRKVSPVM